MLQIFCLDHQRTYPEFHHVSGFMKSSNKFLNCATIGFIVTQLVNVESIPCWRREAWIIWHTQQFHNQISSEFHQHLSCLSSSFYSSCPSVFSNLNLKVENWLIVEQCNIENETCYLSTTHFGYGTPKLLSSLLSSLIYFPFTVVMYW